MGKYKIQVATENCTGCLRCQLACSELYTRDFNPHMACIQVVLSGTECIITFTEKCRECGVCADTCFYDALRKEEKEAPNEQ